MSENGHKQTWLVQKDGWLPIFRQVSWEAHISAFIQEGEAQTDSKWRQGAIAASMLRRYREESVRCFAAAVKCSTSRIYDLINTYELFSQLCASEAGLGRPLAQDMSLSWSHYNTARYFDNPLEMIERAADEQWSVEDMRKMLTQDRISARLREASIEHRIESDRENGAAAAVTADGKPVGASTAKIAVTSKSNGTALSPTRRYTVLQIRAQLNGHDIGPEIKQSMAGTSVLFFWTKSQELVEAIDRMTDWKYRYLVELVVVKERHHASVLVGARGDVGVGALTMNGSVFKSAEELYKLIESNYPGPYLEIEGHPIRRPRKDWTLWQNR